MLDHEFDRKSEILYVNPTGRLEKEDFIDLANDIDPTLNENGKIRGIVITAATFPFWKDFEAMVAHFKFVRDHHRKVEKIAIITDDVLATFARKLTKHFVKAQVRVFKTQDRAEAEAWVKEGAHKAAS